MEREYLERLASLPLPQQQAAAQALACPIVYADPMDLTEMLNIPPGTGILEGVPETEALFYPG